MGLSNVQKNVKKLLDVNTKKRALEREEKALKAFFKEKRAELGERIFEWKDVRVTVEDCDKVRVNVKGLRAAHPSIVRQFETCGTSEKVTVKRLSDQEQAEDEEEEDE